MFASKKTQYVSIDKGQVDIFIFYTILSRILRTRYNFSVVRGWDEIRRHVMMIGQVSLL